METIPPDSSSEFAEAVQAGAKELPVVPIDSSADLEGALHAVSPERVQETRKRQEAVAQARRRSLGALSRHHLR